ncbi:EEF1A lysine methyltransferase 4 isoform X2 [Gasterosteus aculeatus]
MEYLPEENSRYKDIDYWDERYKTEQCYDWLGSFSKFQHILEKHVLKEDSILILGCGNSSMSGDMYNAGYHGITNIDYSSVCIGTMSDRYSDCVGMTWHQMDVRRLSFPDASFDVIIEKATLDAIMVEEKTPWEVSPQADGFIHQALTEPHLPLPLQQQNLHHPIPEFVPGPVSIATGFHGNYVTVQCFPSRQARGALKVKVFLLSFTKIKMKPCVGFYTF